MSIYREAGSKVVDLINKKVSCIIEKASIDEVYLDLTDEANKRLHSLDFEKDILPVCIKSYLAGQDESEIIMSKDTLRRGYANNDEKEKEKEKDQHQPTDASLPPPWMSRHPLLWPIEDRLIAAAAMITYELRALIFDELHFSSSAGVAHNKLLAKLGSSMHKPNKQTILPSNMVQGIMKSLPLSRIRGFGGKLGKNLEEKFQATTGTYLFILINSSFCFNDNRLLFTFS